MRGQTADRYIPNSPRTRKLFTHILRVVPEPLQCGDQCDPTVVRSTLERKELTIGYEPTVALDAPR